MQARTSDLKPAIDYESRGIHLRRGLPPVLLNPFAGLNEFS